MELLTELKIRSLKPTDKEQNYREKNGFVLRIQGTSKAFYHIYNYKNKRCKMLLGSWPAVSLSEARTKHRENLLLLQQGIDPRTTKAAPKPAPDKPETFTISDLIDEYIKHCIKNKSQKTAAEDERLLNKHLLPAAGTTAVTDLRRRDAIALVESIAEKAPGTARALMKISRAMYTYAIDREHTELNPFSGVSRTVQAVRPTDRERVLSDTEIKTVWQTLTAKSDIRSERTRRALLLILITGQRPGEVSGITTDEIDGDWWTIPAARSKNGQEHSIYLSELAKGIIGQPTGPVFPGPTGSAIDRAALSHYVRKNKVLAGMNFTPHDLRRTAATGLSKLGATDEIIDAVLNHQKQGIIRVYNRNRYESEKREWLNRWSEYLQSII